MKITTCPKCQKNGGYLAFRQAGNSKTKYPYVGHYDSSKNSRTRWCYLTKNLLSNVEFTNSINNQDVVNYQNSKTIKHELLETVTGQMKLLKKFQPKHAKLIKILHDHHPKKYKEFLSTLSNYHDRLYEINNVEQNPLKAAPLVMTVTSAWIEYLSWTYEIYVKLPKFHITKKQIKKITTLRRKDVPPLSDPKNKDEALQYKFVGIQCQNCGSWRIDEKHISMKYRTFHCYACGKDINKPFSSQNLVSHA